MKILAVTLTLLTLAAAGAASADILIRHLTLQPGRCTVLAKTRVCAARPQPRTVTVTVTTTPTTSATTTRPAAQWWPAGYIPWTGAGLRPANGIPLLAYQPTGCNGSQLGNATCWSYEVIANVAWNDGTTGCPHEVYAAVHEIQNGVIIGDDNDLIDSAPNMQPVLLHGLIYNAPAGATVDLAQLDCR